MTPRRYLKVLRSQRLNSQERDAIRSRLVAFLHENPLPTGVRWAARMPIYFLHLSRTVVTVSLSALVLLIGSGISYAAEGSLPGDLLYPVKVQVNEPVRAALAITTHARAQWDIERAERRLIESEELIARGKLDQASSAALAAEFEKHSSAIAGRIESLNSKNDISAAAAINSDFSATLRAHHTIIRLLSEEPETETRAWPLLATVERQSNSGLDALTTLQESVSGQAASEAKKVTENGRKRADSKLKEARSLYNRKGTDISAEVKTEIDAKIMDAAALYTRAEEKSSENAYGEAFTLYQQANRAAQEAKLLVKSRKHFALGIQQGKNAQAAKNAAAAPTTTAGELESNGHTSGSTDSAVSSGEGNDDAQQAGAKNQANSNQNGAGADR